MLGSAIGTHLPLFVIALSRRDRGKIGATATQIGGKI
jgi:hypothetical protein